MAQDALMNNCTSNGHETGVGRIPGGAMISPPVDKITVPVEYNDMGQARVVKYDHRRGS